MKKYRVYQVDSFTTRKFEGNPAGVVANADGLTDRQMQAIARELNNSETAFILSPEAGDHDVRIRFFTPTTEVPTCGHATIAAHYVYAMENRLGSQTVIQRIGIGTLPVDIVKSDSGYRMIMTQGAPEIHPPVEPAMKNDILGALGLTPRDLDERCPMQVSSTGSAKMMIGIKTRETLNRLGPDMNRLKELTGLLSCNGHFVFTLEPHDPDILSHGRMFAPAIGINEDPVTGNANGPLGAYLVKNRLLPASKGTVTFNGKQGEAIGRPGIVTVTVETRDDTPVKVQVAGEAVVAFQTEMLI